MNIYDRIKLLPEELENLIYKYVFYMNIGGVNKAFNKLLIIKYDTIGVDNQKYYFNKKIKSLLGIDLYKQYNKYPIFYNDYPNWINLKQTIRINNNLYTHK